MFSLLSGSKHIYKETGRAFGPLQVLPWQEWTHCRESNQGHLVQPHPPSLISLPGSRRAAICSPALSSLSSTPLQLRARSLQVCLRHQVPFSPSSNTSESVSRFPGLPSTWFLLSPYQRGGEQTKRTFPQLYAETQYFKVKEDLKHHFCALSFTGKIVPFQEGMPSSCLSLGSPSRCVL